MWYFAYEVKIKLTEKEVQAMEHSSNNEQLPKDVQPTEQNDPQAVSAPQSTEKKEKRTTILSASALVCIAVALV